MIIRFFIPSILITLLLLALVAPFTWLKVKEVDNAKEKATVQNVEPVVSVKPQDKERVAVKQVKIAPKPKVIPPTEKALHSVVLPEFDKIRDVKEKKRQFFAFIKPAVVSENNKLLALRKSIQVIAEKLSLEEPLLVKEHELLAHNANKYKVSEKYSELHQATELLSRIDIVPTELVLVQAANESAWGTSRFARIGLNYFGLWCYRKGCGLVPAGRNTGAKHEVAAFRTLDHAAERYLFNINTHNAYSTFRQIRSQLRAYEQPLSPEILATGLLAYSQRGSAYILELTDMIRHNRAYF